jgi:hypothetical protein
VIGRRTTPVAQRRSPRTRRACRRRGLTLLELLLGISVTVIIGAAVASMLLVASAASAHQQTSRDFSVWQGVVTARLGTLLRSSGMVLASRSDYLVLWTSDADRDGEPSASEIAVVLRHSGANELWCYRPPEEMAVEKNFRYSLLTTDFATEPLVPAMLGQLWADDVLDLEITLDTVDPIAARFVAYRLTTNLDSVENTTIGGAALRN